MNTKAKARRTKSKPRSKPKSTSRSTKSKPKPYTVEEIAGGWRCRVDHPQGPFIVAVEAPRLGARGVQATVSVYREAVLLHRDSVNLTSDRARRRFFRAPQLAALRLDPRVLTALEEVCRRPPEPAEEPPGNHPTATARHPYVRTRAGIGRRLVDGVHLLCNADFEILSELVEDDGFNPGRLFYEIEGRCAGRCARTVVRADQFAALGWIPSLLGAQAIPAAGQSAHDHLRAAIQHLSTHPLPRRVILTHAGWRDHGDGHVYCFNGGAISRDGLVADVEARLSGSLARLRFPTPPTGHELRNAVRASLALRELGPSAIMLPLLGVTYLPPLRPLLGVHVPDFLLWLLGGSGTFKSELVALAMAHYGDFSRLSLPASFEATANALERLQFDAKDALLAVDDYYPAPDLVRAR